MKRAAPRLARPPRVLRKAIAAPRPAYATQVNTDAAFEREADDAASRCLLGETNLARRLTATRRSTYALPASSGVALPQLARAQLEHAFGADLSHVRLHHDAAANTAARDFGAAAFTAGRDIYFGARRFDPSGRHGFRLLAHEVAHVLQQIRGTGGGIQRDPLKGREAVENLEKNHKATWGSVRALDDMILKVQIALGDTTEMEMDSGAGNGLAEDAIKGRDGGSPASASYLGDVLKKLKGSPVGKTFTYLEAAAKILDRDTKHEIKNAPAPFMIAHLEDTRDQVWFDHELDHPLVKPYWDDIYNTFRALVFNPYATAPPLYANGKPFKKHAADLEAAMATTPYIMNDRVVVTIRRLLAFDDARAEQMGIWLTDAKASSPRVWSQRLSIASKLEKWAKVSYDASTRPKWKKLFLALEVLGREAQKFWGTSTHPGAAGMVQATGALMYLERYEDRVARLTAPAELEPEKVVARRGVVPETTELLELRKILTDNAKLIFELDADSNVIDKTAYAQRVSTLKAQLTGEPAGSGGLIGKLTGAGGRLGLRLAASPEGPQLDQKEFAVIGFIIGWIAMTSERWPAYSAATDTENFQDQRHYHRHLLADMLIRIAIFANFADLEELCRKVLQGRDVGTSYVVISGQWEEQPAAVERMMLDFGPKEQTWRFMPKGSTEALPHSVHLRSIVEYFKLEKLRAVNQELENILANLETETHTRESRIDLSSVKKVRVDRPKRYTAKGFHIIINPEDRKDGKSTIELWRLLADHAKTRMTLKAPAGGDLLVPKGVPLGEYSELAAWIIPNLDPMIEELQKNPALTKLVPKSTDLKQWMIDLSSRLNSDPEAIAEEIHRGLSSSDDKLKGTRYELDRKNQLLRRIMGFRRRIAVMGIDEDHGAFEKGDGKSDVIEKADSAMRAAYKFVGDIEPLNDAEIQSAALMFAIAPQMESAFNVTSEAKQQIAPEWFFFLNYAINFGAQGDAQAKLAPFVFEKDGDPSAKTLLDRLPAVTRIKKLLDAAVEKNQKLFGFKSDGVAIQALTKRVTEIGTEVKVGESFEFDGITYTLIWLNPKPFTYHPRMPAVQGSTSLLEFDGEWLDYDKRSDIKLFEIQVQDDDGALPDAVRIERGAPRQKLIERPEEANLGQDEKDERAERRWDDPYFTVMGDRDEMLTHLSGVVFWRTMTVGLDRIATGLEVVGTVLMTLAPGGAEIAVGMMVLNLADLLTNEEFLDLIDKVVTNPGEVVKGLADRFGSMFDPENIWEFLFFSQNHPVFDKLVEVAASSKRKVQAKPKGKFGKLIRFIVEFGKRILRVFRRIRLLFRPPIAGLHSTFITHPWLSWLLEKGLELIDIASDLYQKGASIADKFDTSGLALSAKITEMMGTFTKLELPDELIPTENIVEFFISFILSKIPYARVARPILDETGATAEIAKWLTKEFNLKESIANPNQLYRQFILEPFGTEIMHVRDELVKELYGVINKVLAEINVASFELPVLGTLKLPTVPTVEMQTARSSDRGPDGKPMVMPRDSGQRLGPRAAARAASAFRQDFGHVRLHQDAVADRFAASAGADAITSGSHIFLRSTVSATSDVGQKLLSHELAHVVQQTGSRPLDKVHADTPVGGKLGRGLTWNREAEAEAERAAHDASGNRVVVIGSSIEGAQPSLTKNLLPKLARRFTQLGQPSEFEETFLEGEMEDPDAYKNVWKSIQKMLKQAQFTPFLAHVEIKKEINKTLGELAAEMFGKVAILAQDKSNRPAKGKKQKTKLDKREFVRALEGFIMAKTGITMQVSLSTHKDPKITGVDITYLFLPRIDGTSPLWKNALEDSIYTEGTETVRLLPKDAKEKDVQATQPMVRGRLDAIGPKPFVWHEKDYKLSKRFVKDFDATKGEILEHAAYANAVDKKSGLGLRVSTHGDLSRRTPRMGRHSHHTTQFVLVQFLRNRHRITAFPVLGKEDADAIGMTLDADSFIKTVAKLKLGGDGSLDPNNKTRGDGMPALMLAPETHLRGNLHIESELDESTDSQSHGEAAAKKFFGALPAPLSARPPDAAVWSKEIRKDKGEAVAKAIRAAANKTFDWMYEEKMRPPIANALKTLEKPYYERLANVDPAKPDPKYVLTDDDLSGVVKKAHENNQTIFGNAGFTAKK